MPNEPAWWLVLVQLAGGFVLLFKGADWLVDGSASIARRYGVSVLVVGLTVVAFGTSAPEIVVSALAAAEGKADISLGNVLGSNIANIGLVLGASALVLPRVLESRLAAREVFWLFAAIAILWYVALDRSIVRTEALLLLGAFGAYNAHVFVTARASRPPSTFRAHESGAAPRIVVGIVAIAIGAKLVVVGAESGALRLGIPGSVVGLTVVAIGTSLPELAAGLGGAFKGESEISVGNVVGSNVFNLLAVIGIVALVQPLDPAAFRPENAAELDTAFRNALNEDFFVVLGFSVAAVGLPHLGRSLSGRIRGATLLALYVAYSIWLFASRAS